MPYITQTARLMIADGFPVTTAGELNYVITKELLSDNQNHEGAVQSLILDYVRYHGFSYSTANVIIGALECARREFKRRRGSDPAFLSEIATKFYDAVVAPYEDKKIQENGDVYGTDSHEL